MSWPTIKKTTLTPDAALAINAGDVARRILRLTRDPTLAIKNVTFGDVSWFALLYLYLAKAENQRISVTELRAVLGIPTTSAQRVMLALEASGHIVREQDLKDRRRFNLALDADVEAAVERQLEILQWANADP